MGNTRILDLFARDPERPAGFSLEACGLLFDYSKNPVSAETRRQLVALAEDASVPAQIAAMFEGRRINVTENRSVLHTAFAQPLLPSGHGRRAGRHAGSSGRPRPHARHGGKNSWRHCQGLHGRQFTDVVNIGIGGSDLGPLMVTTALRPYGSPGLRAHFVSNIDGAHLAATLAGLDPETTLFIH